MRHVTRGHLHSSDPVIAMRRTLAVFSFCLALAAGCGALERWACGEPCEGGVTPPDGAEADFTLAGQDDERAAISTPSFCEEIGGETAHVVHVVTRGADTEVGEGEWISDRLRPQLAARDLPTGWGVGPCTDPADPEAQGVRLSTTTWTDMDAIVQTILELAEEDDVALELTIAIEPVVALCPQDDCSA